MTSPVFEFFASPLRQAPPARLPLTRPVLRGCGSGRRCPRLHAHRVGSRHHTASLPALDRHPGSCSVPSQSSPWRPAAGALLCYALLHPHLLPAAPPAASAALATRDRAAQPTQPAACRQALRSALGSARCSAPAASAATAQPRAAAQCIDTRLQFNAPFVSGASGPPVSRPGPTPSANHGRIRAAPAARRRPAGAHFPLRLALLANLNCLSVAVERLLGSTNHFRERGSDGGRGPKDAPALEDGPARGHDGAQQARPGSPGPAPALWWGNAAGGC